MKIKLKRVIDDMTDMWEIQVQLYDQTITLMDSLHNVQIINRLFYFDTNKISCYYQLIMFTVYYSINQITTVSTLSIIIYFNFMHSHKNRW